MNKESVIALGGGALLRDENRAFAESSGQDPFADGRVGHFALIVCTMMLASVPCWLATWVRNFRLCLPNVKQHYNSFPLLIHVDGKTAEQNAHQVQVVLGRHHLSAMGEYDVIVGQVSSLTNFPMQNPIIVTDENVAKFHLEKIQAGIGLNAKSIIVPAGEEHKNLETISFLWKSFLENGLGPQKHGHCLGRRRGR